MSNQYGADKVEMFARAYKSAILENSTNQKIARKALLDVAALHLSQSSMWRLRKRLGLPVARQGSTTKPKFIARSRCAA